MSKVDVERYKCNHCGKTAEVVNEMSFGGISPIADWFTLIFSKKQHSSLARAREEQHFCSSACLRKALAHNREECEELDAKVVGKLTLYTVNVKGSRALSIKEKEDLAELAMEIVDLLKEVPDAK